jgi:hypothetical protein
MGPFHRAWNNYPILWPVLAALLVRLFVVAFVFRDQTDPTDHYAQFGWEMGWVARSIALGHGFSSPFFPATGPTALVPPLFPYLIAGIFSRLWSLHCKSCVRDTFYQQPALCAYLRSHLFERTIRVGG